MSRTSGPLPMFFRPYFSQYPPSHDDTYVKTTTKFSTDFWAYYATDPTKSLIGSWTGTGWLSQNGIKTNQRFHIDIGSAKIIKRIYYENIHASGTSYSTSKGVNNFTLWGSNTESDFLDLVYANNGTWVQLTTVQSTLDRHIDANQADPKYILVTNSVAYRYYAFKFADNQGGTAFMGFRRIELQSK